MLKIIEDQYIMTQQDYVGKLPSDIKPLDPELVMPPMTGTVPDNEECMLCLGKECDCENCSCQMCKDHLDGKHSQVENISIINGLQDNINNNCNFNKECGILGLKNTSEEQWENTWDMNQRKHTMLPLMQTLSLRLDQSKISTEKSVVCLLNDQKKQGLFMETHTNWSSLTYKRVIQKNSNEVLPPLNLKGLNPKTHNLSTLEDEYLNSVNTYKKNPSSLNIVPVVGKCKNSKNSISGYFRMKILGSPIRIIVRGKYIKNKKELHITNVDSTRLRYRGTYDDFKKDLETKKEENFMDEYSKLETLNSLLEFLEEDPKSPPKEEPKETPDTELSDVKNSYDIITSFRDKRYRTMKKDYGIQFKPGDIVYLIKKEEKRNAPRHKRVFDKLLLKGILKQANLLDHSDEFYHFRPRPNTNLSRELKILAGSNVAKVGFNLLTTALGIPGLSIPLNIAKSAYQAIRGTD